MSSFHSLNTRTAHVVQNVTVCTGLFRMMLEMNQTLEISSLSLLTSKVSEDEEMLLSNEGRKIFTIINFVIICGALSVVGGMGNIINMLVFIKQGIGTSVNISLLGLAVADFSNLFTLAVISVFVNPFFEEADTILIPPEVLYLIGGWPHICFSRITCWITVYITGERCLCIALPLTVKRIITPTRTAVAVCVIYVLMTLSIAPEYTKAYIGWKVYPITNKTKLGLVFTNKKEPVEGLVFILNGVLGIASFPLVTIFTVVLLLQLKLKIKWRKGAVKAKDHADVTTDRDKKAMSMIAFIACVLILCYTPDLVVTLLIFAEPQFNILGKYFNLGLILYSFGLVCHAINSSINIFIYYSMSSKYKHTFHVLFSKQ